MWLAALLSLLLLLYILFFSFSNKSLIEISCWQDDKACNKGDQASVSVFIEGDED